jgi:hypothetical protein
LGSDKARLLLGAARSIVHDTRNRLTGLSLCLTAWSNTGAREGERSEGDIAILDRSLASLAELCAEFAGVETALTAEMRSRAAPSVAQWYAGFLRVQGFDAAASDSGGQARLTRAAEGLLSRALLQLADGLASLHASNVEIATRSNDGALVVEVSFDSMYPPERVGVNSSVRAAVALVDGSGGAVEMSGAEGRTTVVMMFARNAASGL